MQSKQIQEQLEGVRQQAQELEPKCAELKAEAQRHDSLLKSSEVSRCPLASSVSTQWPSRALTLIVRLFPGGSPQMPGEPEGPREGQGSAVLEDK